MPRKPKQKKQQITIAVNGKPVKVTLSPPDDARKSWYAYWTGLSYSKSTGQREFDQAVVAVETMLRNGGRKARLQDAVMSDDEFRKIQIKYYRSKPDLKRAEKSLTNCLEAIDAFVDISGISPVASATPDDCAAFQRRALELPKTFRLNYPKKKTQDVACYSRQTILKWSRALQAASKESMPTVAKNACVGSGVIPNCLRQIPGMPLLG